jgi:phosphatidate cytidylyltransferase
MLRTRLLVSAIVIAVLVLLGWLDHRASIPGMWLAPAVVLFAVLATREMLHLYAANRLTPWPPAVYLGTLLILAAPWLPLCVHGLGRGPLEGATPAAPVLPPGALSEHWTLLAVAVSMFVVLAGEMARFRQPGGATANLSVAVFSIAYLGLLGSFAVRLRLDWGIGALASLIIVTKVGDTGAYFFGKTFGRHPMAPTLSPKKTMEGLLGAMVFSLGAAWTMGLWVMPSLSPSSSPTSPLPTRMIGWGVFGLFVGGFGAFGDLVESLLKRDSQCKDSSAWVPGLGGVLDMLDSVLTAAPIAYGCWLAGIVGS